MSDSRLRERHALLTRISRLAGPNGIAAGVMSDGEAWTVQSRTIPNLDYVAPEPGPKDVVGIRVVDGFLHAELRDGTLIVAHQDSQDSAY